MQIGENYPMKKILTCPICLSPFEYPTNLSCGHTFCINCINETLGKQTAPSCPICRKPTFKPLNDDWVADDLLIELQRLANEFTSDKLKQEFQQIVICLDCGLNPVQPVILPCQHLFCLSCITEHLKNDLICPACNEWAAYLPGSIYENTKYMELLQWNFEMEEEKLNKQINSNSVSGMPVFWFDEQICIGSQNELLFIEQRYQQLLKISTNGSGHFPILSLVEGQNFYGNLVTVTKVKTQSNKQIVAQLKGYRRIIVDEVYTYNSTGQKISFSYDQYQKLPGQLWMSNFKILKDEIQDQENILMLWESIKNVLQAGFNQMNNQLKELFFPAFCQIQLTKDKQPMSQIEVISEASLVLLQLLKLSNKEFQKLYYTANLKLRLSSIWQKIEEIKIKIQQILGNNIVKMDNISSFAKCRGFAEPENNSNILNPYSNSSDEDEYEDDELALMQLGAIDITSQIFLHLFKLEKVASFLNY